MSSFQMLLVSGWHLQESQAPLLARALRSGPVCHSRQGPKRSPCPPLVSDTNQPPQEPSHQRGQARRGWRGRRWGPPAPSASFQGDWARGHFRWMRSTASPEGDDIPAPPPSARPSPRQLSLWAALLSTRVIWYCQD